MLAQATYPPPPPTPTPNPTKSPKPTPTKSPKATKSPKPTKTPNANHPCVITGTQNGKDYKQTNTFKAGQKIVVRGSKNCAPSGGTVTTLFDPAGNKATIGTSKAGSSGAYTNRGHIPNNAGPGTHVIQSRTGGKRYSTSIKVQNSTKQSPAGFLASPTGIVGLGIALALLALVVVLKPRRRQLLPAMGTETTTVPSIDTSGFSPMLTKDTKSTPRKRSPRKRTT